MSGGKTLIKLWYFWLALLFPICLGLGISIVIYLVNDLGIDWTKSGLNTFLEYFRIPLTISSLSIPATALVAAIHRSEQTFVTIAESKKQNTFSNALKHREEFIKLLKELEVELDVKFYDKYKLYIELFPENKSNSFDKSTNEAWFLRQAITYSALVERASGELEDRQIEGILIDSFKLSAELCFRVNKGYEINSPSTYFQHLNDKEFVIAYQQDRPLKHLQLVFNVLSQLMYFCEIQPKCELKWPHNDHMLFAVRAMQIVSRYKKH